MLIRGNINIAINFAFSVRVFVDDVGSTNNNNFEVIYIPLRVVSSNVSLMMTLQGRNM
jgi:hypothetical protein